MSTVALVLVGIVIGVVGVFVAGRLIWKYSPPMFLPW